MTDKLLKDDAYDNVDNKINMIMRQTNYDYDEAKIKLQDFNGDYLEVIKNYMGISTNKSKN